MQYIKSSEFQLHNSAVALGKFEGIHLGHQLLLNELKEKKSLGLNSVVFTFDMPPRAAINGDKKFSQIFTKEERRRFLEQQGMDVMLEHPFTKEFAASSPEEFIENVLVKKVDAKVIVVGSDFHFGKKRSGSVANLRAMADRFGYDLIVKEKVQHEGKDISSTRIRELLEYGKMEKAAALLGRNYTIYGEVVHGKALGRTIQIPTINQIAEEVKLIPPNGVYVSKVHIDGETYHGVTNIGIKPTVEDSRIKGIETHIFDYSGDLYGKMVEVELLHFHRAELRFQNVEELKTQMQKDILFAKNYFR